MIPTFESVHRLAEALGEGQCRPVTILETLDNKGQPLFRAACGHWSVEKFTRNDALCALEARIMLDVQKSIERGRAYVERMQAIAGSR